MKVTQPHGRQRLLITQSEQACKSTLRRHNMGFPQPTGGGGSGAILSTGKISLTSAQLLALFSDPVTIIPAPGAGKMILVIAAIYELIYGSTTYEGSDANQ